MKTHGKLARNIFLAELSALRGQQLERALKPWYGVVPSVFERHYIMRHGRTN